jgi:hypothetical protein
MPERMKEPAQVHLGVPCSGGGCKERARWRPVLILRTANGGTATVSLPVAICESHLGRRRRVVDTLALAGADVIEKVLADLGFEIPDIDWERSAIRYVAVT